MSVQAERLEISVKELIDNAIKSLFKMGAIQEFHEKKDAVPTLDITVKLDTSINECSGPSTAKKTVVLRNSTKFVVSKMGSAAIKGCCCFYNYFRLIIIIILGGLELSRAFMLYEDLHQAQNSLVLLDCLHLLYLVTPYDTSEQIKPNMQVYYYIVLAPFKKIRSFYHISFS